jgi:hypothetical protein
MNVNLYSTLIAYLYVTYDSIEQRLLAGIVFYGIYLKFLFDENLCLI